MNRDALPSWRQLAQACGDPLTMFIDPGERVYWPLLLTSFFIVVWALAARDPSATSSTGTWRSRVVTAARSALDRRIWSHPSAWLDYKLLFAKALLRGVTWPAWGVSTVGLTLSLVTGLDTLFGSTRIDTVPVPIVTVAYTLVLFVAWDLSRYALHRVMHRVPVLWAFHKVHHSARVLTPLTLYRSHPVEAGLFWLRGVVVTATVTATWFHLFGRQAIELEILGVNALGFVFNLAGGNLRHCHVAISFGRLERLFLSPAQHQIHHGINEDEQNSNYGTWLAVWDRIGGSLRLSHGARPRRFGLDPAATNHRSDALGSALLSPMLDGLAHLIPKRWSTRRRLQVGVATVTVWSCPATTLAEPVETPSTPPANTTVPPADTTTPPASPAPPPSPSPTPDPTMPPTSTIPTPTTSTTTPTTTTPAATPPTASRPPTTGAPAPVTPTAAPPSEPASTPEPSFPPSADADTTAIEDAAIEIEIEPDESAPTTDLASEIEPPVDEEIVAVDTVWVVGRPELLPRVAGSAHTIGERDLERFEYDDVHRVLRRVPGVYVRGEDGFGLRPNIGLRGANSDRSAKLTLMEDGILLTPAPYSAPAAYFFPLMTRITSVELFKGPAAVRHGPNTIGGAINLHSRAMPASAKGFVDLGLGRFDYGKAHGYWGTSGRRFGVLLEGVHLQTSGFKELDGGGDTGFAKNEAELKLRYHNDPGARHFHQGTLTLGYADEESAETYLGLTDADFEATPYRRYAASQRDHMSWWRLKGMLGYYYGFGDRVDLQVRAYRHDFDRSWRKLNRFRGGPELSQLLANPDAGQAAVYTAVLTGHEDSTTDAQALMIGTNHRQYVSEGVAAVSHWRPTWGPVSQEIEFGARLHHDYIERHHTEDAYRMVSGTLIAEGTPTEDTTRNRGEALAGSLHVHDQLTIGPLSLSPGVRMEIIGTRFRDRLTDDDDLSRRDVVVIPGGGAHVQANPWLGLFAGVHAGFSPVAPGQAAEVEPERSLNYEAGARLGDEHSAFEATGFFNDYRNLTGECTFSAGCNDDQLNRQFNAGRVHVHGVEALAGHTFEWRARYWASLMATYTLTRSSFREAFESAFPQFGEVAVGDQLPYVPEHQAALILGGGGRHFALHASGVYVGEMRDNAGQGAIDDDERIADYFVLDLSGEAKITDRVGLYVNVENATNARYVVSRRPFGARPGRPVSWMTGLRVTFD